MSSVVSSHESDRNVDRRAVALRYLARAVFDELEGTEITWARAIKEKAGDSVLDAVGLKRAQLTAVLHVLIAALGRYVIDDTEPIHYIASTAADRPLHRSIADRLATMLEIHHSFVEAAWAKGKPR
jgi:hypothetical protein